MLDAGCGTGRVAIELARRGIETVGVDLDPGMLNSARRKAPDLAWQEADLAALDLPTRFDVCVLAGNVMIFLTPGSEGSVVAGLARHLVPGGALVAGFQLRPGGLDLDTYDHFATIAGLRLEGRWATWERCPSPRRRLRGVAPPEGGGAYWSGSPAPAAGGEAGARSRRRGAGGAPGPGGPRRGRGARASARRSPAAPR